MNAFCIEKIQIEPGLRAVDSLLRAASLRLTSDARVAAGRIMQEAQTEADRIRQDAHAEGERLAQEAEGQVFQRAESLLRTLAQANETLVARAADIVVDLSQTLFNEMDASHPRRHQKCQSGDWITH